MTKCLSIVAGVLCATWMNVAYAQTGMAGKWQGETGNGRPVALDLSIKGTQATGTFTLARQTAEITDGKVSGKTVSFKVAIEGRTPAMTGELVGEQLKLIVEGVSNPVMMSRAK